MTRATWFRRAALAALCAGALAASTAILAQQRAAAPAPTPAAAEAGPDGIRRSGAPRRSELPPRRPVARRPRHRRDRGPLAAEDLLHGRRQRRRLPHRRRRRHLDADHRRPDPARLDRRDRRGRHEPGHHLCRHRLGRRAQQRLDRARHLQEHGRRQDLGLRRPARRRANGRPPHPPHQPRHRPRRNDRRHLQAEHRARHLQDGGRRQDLEEDAVPERTTRGDGRRVPAGQPRRGLRVDVATRAEAVDDHQRRQGRRLLQEHRRRRHLHEDLDRPAHRADRQGQPGDDGGEPEPRLRPRRGTAGRRALPVRRRRADVGAR